MKLYRLPVMLVAALAVVFGSVAANAQKYPVRPVKIIVPYAPGGATDIVARIIADELTKITGQGFVVFNKPGAFGLLAIEEMAKAEPDGYTLMVGNVSTNAITPILYKKKLSIDYAKDVVAVTNLIDVPAFLLVTAKDFPPKTVPEFIAYAKKNPGKVRYGSVGIGSYPHYDMAYFAKRAGDLDMIHIPNKNGAAGSIQDMIRGDAQAAFLNVASTAGMVQAGQLRPIALVNRTRLAEYPNLPTMQEVGFPGVGTLAWNGMFARAATPKPVLQAIHDDVLKALKSPEVVAKLTKQHFNIVPSASLADANKWLAGEMKHWETITQTVKLDIKP
jgi:tripartite-type tricarboxylate transporter receptor subunit TctC